MTDIPLYAGAGLLVGTMVGLTGAREAAARLETINLPVTWLSELAQLHFALSGLKGMLGVDFPA